MLMRIDSFRIENRASRSYVGIYVQSFPIWTTYVLVSYFIVICSSRADRKDTADGTEKSFVSRRAALNTIQTAYEPARTTRNGKLGFLSLSFAQSE